MWSALAAIGAKLPADVRVVVLNAVGPSFSAGLDRSLLTAAPGGPPTAADPGLVGLAAADDATIDQTIAGYQEAFTWWRQGAAVTIAAVAGHAVGAGFQLALACDLCLVADDARFAMREVSLGLVPDLAGTGALVAAVGYPRALELCATGRWVGALEAVDLGLALMAVPADELPAAVADLVAALLAAPAPAVAEVKQLLLGAGGQSAADQLSRERQAQRRRLRDLAASITR
jgi:enoyl-CoA hydratase/carnithine racemase